MEQSAAHHLLSKSSQNTPTHDFGNIFDMLAITGKFQFSTPSEAQSLVISQRVLNLLKLSMQYSEAEDIEDFAGGTHLHQMLTKLSQQSVHIFKYSVAC